MMGAMTLSRAARLGGGLVLYAVAFVCFAYVSFPYERLGRYVVSQYNAAQTGSEASSLEIDGLTWSWRFPGLVADEVRLVSTPKAEEVAQALRATDVHVTTSLFGLLTGGESASFGANALGGEIEGSVSQSDTRRRISLELEGVNPNLAPQVADFVGLPIVGRLTGQVDLSMPPGKLSLAEGRVEVVVEDMVVGDGKAKIQNLIALPALRVGQFRLKSDVAKGRVKFVECGASGEDLDLKLQGDIRLRERLSASIADLEILFSFAERYREKDAKTKVIFGDGKVPGLFETATKAFIAKQEDGSFGMRLNGPFHRVKPRPLKPRKARGKSARTRSRRNNSKAGRDTSQDD